MAERVLVVASEEQREDFKLYAKAWLTTFARIFEASKSATNAPKILRPTGAPLGKSAGSWG